MSNIKKTNWISNFKLIGKVKINDNSFKIDEVSDSGWKYNSLNLAVDCGEKFGIIYSSLMGGFSTKNKNVVYVHGKDENGGDDFKNRFTVDWDDRLNDSVLENVGDFCFLNMGFEKTVEGKTFKQKFLSAYDAIAYAEEHLTDGMTVCVKGNLKYSFYKDKVTMQREITSIMIVDAEPSDFEATFTQSILLDSDSVIKDEIDKDTNSVFVHARVLDYVKELNGVEIKGQYPMSFNFDFDFDSTEQFATFYKNIFKTKNGTIKQVNFEGKFVNTGAVINATMDDVPDDVKVMIDMGLYTADEILTKYAVQGAVTRRCVLTRPMVKMEGDENPRPVVQVFEERYVESDFDFDIPTVDPILDDMDFSDIDDLFN